MKLELFKTFEQKEHLTVDVPAREFELEDDDISFQDPVHIICTIENNRDVSRIHCKGSIQVALRCARCAEEFTRMVSGEFSLVVRRLRKGETEPEFTDDDNDMDEEKLIFIDSDTNTIDITEFVHDAILLEIPLNAVCRKSCKGLCSQCGQNLNEKSCNCKKVHRDTRWKELSNLFDT